MVLSLNRFLVADPQCFNALGVRYANVKRYLDKRNCDDPALFVTERRFSEIHYIVNLKTCWHKQKYSSIPSDATHLMNIGAPIEVNPTYVKRPER